MHIHIFFVIKYPKYHCPPLSEKIRKTLGQKNTTKLCIYICVQYLRMLWKTTPKEYQHAKIHVFSLVWGSMIQNHDLGCARGENLADFCTGKFPIPFHDLTHRIHGAGIYGAPWIPSIYPLYVSKYTSTMDPMGDNPDNYKLVIRSKHSFPYPGPQNPLGSRTEEALLGLLHVLPWRDK